jgi:hypothetical protein
MAITGREMPSLPASQAREGNPFACSVPYDMDYLASVTSISGLIGKSVLRFDAIGKNRKDASNQTAGAKWHFCINAFCSRPHRE